jgi:hypothetical protein
MGGSDNGTTEEQRLARGKTPCKRHACALQECLARSGFNVTNCEDKVRAHDHCIAKWGGTYIRDAESRERWGAPGCLGGS